MERDRESVVSLFCSGSHLNRRNFNPEDPWLSVESTILAGNVSLDEEESNSNSKSKTKDLSTVDEERDNATYPSIELEAIVDDNVLNMNIDAISDDEVFFDCASSPCPPRKTKKLFLSPSEYKSPRPKLKLKATPRYGQYLVAEDCISASSSAEPASVETESSSSVEVGQRTGGLIVQIVDDFNDMKDHAQSTPKLSDTDSGYFQLPLKLENSAGSVAERSKSPAKPRPAVPPKKGKSPSFKPMSPVDPANKENYYRGKYSRSVSGRPRTPQRPRRVALMKEFFESRIMSESSAAASKKVAQTPSICYKTTLRKSPRVNDLRSFGSNEASRKKRSARSRPSSCSEFSSTESSVSRVASHGSRSKSTSDTASDSSKVQIKVQQLKNIAFRRYKMYNQQINQRTTLHINSPKESTIKKRRSFGLVVSPIKPVRELRKKFSPRYQGNKSESAKSVTKTPRIICTNEK